MLHIVILRDVLAFGRVRAEQLLPYGIPIRSACRSEDYVKFPRLRPSQRRIRRRRGEKKRLLRTRNWRSWIRQEVHVAQSCNAHFIYKSYALAKMKERPVALLIPSWLFAEGTVNRIISNI